MKLILQARCVFSGATQPYRCQYADKNAALIQVGRGRGSWEGAGRAPRSNITGVSLSLSMARRAALRSSANSGR